MDVPDIRRDKNGEITLYVENLDGVWYGLAYDEGRIFATAFAFNEKRVLHNLLAKIPFNVPFEHSKTTSELAKQVISTLRDIYNGNEISRSFNLAAEHLSEYTRRVLRATSLIPTGYVTSYGSIAEAVGGSPRAVGKVMMSNPFPLIIPCHRVIAADFTPGGYGEGIEVKLGILSREKRGFPSEKNISVDDAYIRVFPVEILLNKYKKRSIVGRKK
jgi:methylated-DNA-[protein]-cysteine S-methyltransferase